MTSSTRISIGFSPRERFAVAAESLASLYEHTTLPFHLYVVDAGTPAHRLDEMRAVLADHDNWTMLHADEPLLPAASRNLILERVDTDHVCLVENDNLFTPGWLEALLDACDRFPADVAAPMIREGRGDDGHFDRHLGTIETLPDGRLEVRRLGHERGRSGEPERVDFVEQHCLLFRSAVFDAIGPYDETLNTRDEVDLSLALHHAGATVVVVPDAIVHYVPPTEAVEPDELDFYRMRWDLERAAASRDTIQTRWNLTETPGDLEFVRYRNLLVELPVVRERLAELAVDGPVVVLDDGDWFGTEVTEGLDLVPFPDVGGHFGGFPESDAAACAELARVTATSSTVVLGWPALWWLDHLPELAGALTAWADAVDDDGRLRVYRRLVRDR